MPQGISFRRRNELMVSIWNSDPYCSMTGLSKDFGISRERVSQILERYKAQRNCANCFHQVDSLCACREIDDMVRTANRCQDWTPQGK